MAFAIIAKGKVENRSRKNELLRYLYAINLISLTS
jgi:hypothetical protein